MPRERRYPFAPYRGEGQVEHGLKMCPDVCTTVSQADRRNTRSCCTPLGPERPQQPAPSLRVRSMDSIVQPAVRGPALPLHFGGEFGTAMVHVSDPLRLFRVRSTHEAGVGCLEQTGHVHGVPSSVGRPGMRGGPMSPSRRKRGTQTRA